MHKSIIYDLSLIILYALKLILFSILVGFLLFLIFRDAPYSRDGHPPWPQTDGHYWYISAEREIEDEELGLEWITPTPIPARH